MDNNSIICAIYHGSLNPSEKYTGGKSEFDEKSGNISEAEDRISALLSDEGK